MTHAEATQKAKDNKGPAISFMLADLAKDLLGKTLSSKEAGNDNRLEVIESINNNYIVRINGNGYDAVAMTGVLQNIRFFNVS